MTYTMKLFKDEFNNIKCNNKRIEVRLNDEKRKKIKSNDKILFYKLPYLDENVLVNVEQVFIFPSFLDIYRYFPITNFGYKNMGVKEILNKIHTIYTKKEEDSMGVVAIKFNILGDSDMKNF
ncbi:ASCH domain-containing protein [Halocella sp. SP3-1]|uniref:ASCH domain-containing protein n=1 Tax=Halocella sp. SP3-1 TaxID=2382161 RepID=UPI000F765563|nr:ASCH domain-containing protein [Halocella sp. SP3-1]AZO94551.1 ASCH domain-containing protein [Halocella sp. SP3-1]